MHIDGRVAFVTGHASGIGRAAALASVRRGASVAVVDRDGASAGCLYRRGARLEHVTESAQQDCQAMSWPFSPPRSGRVGPTMSPSHELATETVAAGLTDTC